MDSFIMLTDYYTSRLKKAKLDGWVGGEAYGPVH